MKDNGCVVIDSNEAAYFEAEKPNRTNCFIEKLQSKFFESDRLHVVVGKETGFMYGSNLRKFILF